jgi:hypothetical protein
VIPADLSLEARYGEQLNGPCVVCGAISGEPCALISPVPEEDGPDARPGDPRPYPHFYRSRDPNEKPAAVPVKDEPPYYLDTPENRARYERERHMTPAERGW